MFVVLEVFFENMPQGSFVEDHDVVQALPSQGADENAPHRGSAKDFSALSAPRGFPFPQLADEMLLRKCNLDHVTDNAARYPRETLPQSAGPSIQLWDALSR